MAFRFLRSASAFALLLAACSGGPGNSRDSASAHTEIENGGSAGSVSAKGNAKAGSGGRTSSKPSSRPGGSAADSEESDTGLEVAGMGGAAGDAGEPPPPCDLEGNCSSDGEGAKVTCDVQAWNECEFNGFVGATAQVGWGQRVVIGTACCGECECVPVEVYYDGALCWQGIPQCNGHFLNPHATTVPNPSFTVRTDVYGTFYLGSGGFGGGEGVDGTGGTAAGTGGSAAETSTVGGSSAGGSSSTDPT
jgi:hypothetical protein